MKPKHEAQVPHWLFGPIVGCQTTYFETPAIAPPSLLKALDTSKATSSRYRALNHILTPDSRAHVPQDIYHSDIWSVLLLCYWGPWLQWLGDHQ
jgi:hypothetical protein